MSIVNLPIDGVKGASASISEKLPTRLKFACSENLTGRVVCTAGTTAASVDTEASVSYAGESGSFSVKPLFVFCGEETLSRQSGGGAIGLFSVLGADGIIEIDVKDGESIEAGQEVIVTDGGKIRGKPGSGDKTFMVVGIALDSVSVASGNRIRVATCVPRSVFVGTSEG